MLKSYILRDIRRVRVLKVSFYTDLNYDLVWIVYLMER